MNEIEKAISNIEIKETTLVAPPVLMRDEKGRLIQNSAPLKRASKKDIEADILDRLMKRPITNKSPITNQEALYQKLFDRAWAGDTRIIIWLIERYWGKTPQAPPLPQEEEPNE